MDRNRHKGASLGRAEALGVPSQRLPVGRLFALESHVILTVCLSLPPAFSLSLSLYLYLSISLSEYGMDTQECEGGGKKDRCSEWDRQPGRGGGKHR